MKPFYFHIYLIGIIIALAVVSLYEINKRNREITALKATVQQTNAHSGTNSISELRYEALWSGFRSALEYVESLDKSIGFMAFEAENDRKRIDKIELILGTELRESILKTGKAAVRTK